MRIVHFAFGVWISVFSLTLGGCASKAPATPGTETPSQPKAITEKTESPPNETPSSPPPQTVRPSAPATPAEPSLIVEPPKPKTPTGTPDEEVVVIETNRGRIVIELYPGDAPEHVKNFKKLVKDRFYEGRANTFHRYVPNFLIQGGDPLGRDRQKAGTGGPGYTLPAEIKRKHVKGAVAAARLPDNVNPKKESNGSQFYICLKDLPELDGEYTVFGQVIEGMEVVERLRVGDEMRKVILEPRASHVK